MATAMSMKFEVGFWDSRLANATMNMTAGRPDCLDVLYSGTFRAMLGQAAHLSGNDLRLRVCDALNCPVGAFGLSGNEIISAHRFASRHPEMNDRDLFIAIASGGDDALKRAMRDHWDDPYGVQTYQYHDVNKRCYARD